jgi:LysM repeat protein/murein endopeptidase
MRQVLRWPRLMTVHLGFLALSTLSIIILSPTPTQALTASFGQPYHGRLVNGVPFPRQFSGYQLREESRTYTTPEVVGALLDAIDAVQKQFPGSPNLYLGDFTYSGGGSINGHRSHQNGRDVDLGMYAKGNRTLDGLVPMNEDNLDVPRTWALLENLLCSQRVQYVFVDRRIQNLLYDYALSRGMDAGYLDRLFGNNRGAVIQHVRNHVDHMHVRFYTPWSTMAAQVGELDDQKRAVIEMAQQSYMPKKVFYYAKGNEKSLDALAQSFGVQRKELCQWNDLHGGEILSPGKCLVFFKRGFELEPVHLAQSLQPDSVPESPVSQYASLRPVSSSVSDASVTAQERERPTREKRSSAPVTFTYKAKRGDTIEKIARRNGIDAAVLARANQTKAGSTLKPGQKISLAGMKVPSGSTSSSCDISAFRKGAGAKSGSVAAGKSQKDDRRASSLGKTHSKDQSSSKNGKQVATADKGSSLKPSERSKSVKTDRQAVAAKNAEVRKTPVGRTSPKVAASPSVAVNSKASGEKGTSASKSSASESAKKSSRNSTDDKKIAPKVPPVGSASTPTGMAKNVRASNKKID